MRTYMVLKSEETQAVPRLPAGRAARGRRGGGWDHTNPPHPHHPCLINLNSDLFRCKNLPNTQN